MRILYVGDPHGEPHDLPDCRALARMVLQVAESSRADLVVLAGDLYNTHAIIHAEVQYFWWEFFEELRQRQVPTLALKGNHDAPGDLASRATALIAHVDQCVTVLHRPHRVGGLVFCPYTTGEQLVKWSADHPTAATLFCHQTFDGSVYENGFYAGDGVDPNLIKQKHIISGHIHTPQEFGKVWYPGAPRWRTLADANVDRAIWLLEFDLTGNLVNKTPYDTGTACRRIVSVEDTPARPLCLKPDPKDDYRVRIRGPRDFIRERLPLFEGWARVQALPTDARPEAEVKESDGVVAAFSKWLEVFVPANGTDKAVLKRMAGDRLGF